ncbi:ornithine--oxo-acid transaminase [Aliidongia dinghuensis]|nr:ornithine--oxo-acid transaminase [Aliidongia dinghuensis]
MHVGELERRYGAQNYLPIPVVLSRGEGVWLWDDQGRKYLDMMSAYSAVSPGHSHPRLVAALVEQAHRLAVPSRAFMNDKLGPLMERLVSLTGLDKVLPMNTGAEAVETAIKAARRWAYQVKGVAQNQAEILVASGNFHGRTTTIVGFSSEDAYRQDFGPFTPGFRILPFGDLAAFEAAVGPNTAAILIEPIQGEAGIRVPPAGFLKGLRQLCDRKNVLLILDEVQSGLGRTGKWFAYQHEDVLPDGVILGKALGGGLLPVSAFVGKAEIMDLFNPGSHGSTFGGNPLASAVALEALNVIEDEQLVTRSAVLGQHLKQRLLAIGSPAIRDVRGLGLWVGVELDPALADARRVCERLAQRGVLTKETHETVVRFAPPLTITRQELDWGLDVVAETINEATPKAVAGRIVPAGHAHGAAAQRATTAASNGPHLVMCPPEHYEVSYKINPWMDPAAWAVSAETLAHDARVGWQKLYDTYRALGANIEIMPAQPGLPDLVFTANCAVVLDRKVLLARYKCAERQGEEAHGRRFFEGLKQSGVVDEIHELPAGVFFEGAGDCYWDPHRRMLWTGWGQRSSLEARTAIERIYGVPTASLKLVDPRFYHLDTAFCVLSGGEVLYVPGAFTEEGRQLMRALIGPERLIAVEDADAETLAANSVAVGRDLVFGSCGAALETQLNARGYTVHRVPLGSFGRSGGSAYCLTLRLDNYALAS